MFERVPIKNRHSPATHLLVQIQIRQVYGETKNPFEPKLCLKRKAGHKGLRYSGIGLFLVQCCGNFYFKIRYCGFQSPSGVR